ncbi:prepilin-type cleavage/methylation N-terminal domain protein [Firmicutes bacterium CAG:83]|nr:prepilin-type cleavage/methylation N-terminal domain protein [Firmicutes bacterium CAG:83]
MLKKLQNKKGFTLMEMLIVVAIIAVLVAIAIPVFNGALTKSKEAADVANVRATYAEWQTAMLTENTKAPADKDAFLKGPAGTDTLTLNYPDKLTVADGTITYTASKLTDAANADSKTFTWTLGTPEIN